MGGMIRSGDPIKVLESSIENERKLQNMLMVCSRCLDLVAHQLLLAPLILHLTQKMRILILGIYLIRGMTGLTLTMILKLLIWMIKQLYII